MGKYLYEFHVITGKNTKPELPHIGEHKSKMSGLANMRGEPDNFYDLHSARSPVTSFLIDRKSIVYKSKVAKGQVLFIKIPKT